MDASWLKENKVIGCPHPHLPSDHFSLLVELAMPWPLGNLNVFSSTANKPTNNHNNRHTHSMHIQHGGNNSHNNHQPFLYNLNNVGSNPGGGNGVLSYPHPPPMTSSNPHGVGHSNGGVLHGLPSMP